MVHDGYASSTQVQDIVEFYCSSYRFTKASAHVQKLEQQGFQAGSLISGNMRNRVMHKLAIGNQGSGDRAHRALLMTSTHSSTMHVD